MMESDVVLRLTPPHGTSSVSTGRYGCSMQERRLLLPLSVLVAVLSLGCSSAPRAQVVDAVEKRDLAGALAAYERLEAMDGTDVAMLGDIGGLHLELAAMGDDAAVRHAAVTQLALGGNAAEDSLDRLSRAEAADPVTRARALQILARRGDGNARALLFGLADSDDPEVVALALSMADPDDDGARLLEALEHPSASMRREAALRLGEGHLGREPLLRLSELARVDPEAQVRSAAVRALGGAGDAGWDPIRERLSDPECSVRMASIRSLVRIDRERAREPIGALLSAPPSPAALEAARVLAMAGDDGDAVVARAYLHAAILQAGSTLRSQAAVALVSLPPDPATDIALRRALAGEEERTVRLGLARALLRHRGSESDARAALAALTEGDDMAALQASLLLAGYGDATVDAIQQFLETGDPVERRVAARGLARDAGRPDLVRPALRDEDALVRVHAAGGLVAAASHAG